MKRSDGEVGSRAVSGEDEVQLVASLVGRRRWGEGEVQGGEERKKRVKLLSLDVEVTEKDESRAIVREVGD